MTPFTTENKRIFLCLERPELEPFAQQFCHDVLPNMPIQHQTMEQFIELLQQPGNPEDLLVLALGIETDGHLDSNPYLVQLVLNSRVPVLVIRDSAQPNRAAIRFDRVVVPLDGSTAAGEAVPIAGRIAQLRKIPVKFAMVIDPVRVIPPAYANDLEAWGVIEELRTTAHWALSQAESMMERAGVSVSSDLLLGSVNASLMASIREHDLVVMTTHGPDQRNLRYGDSVAMRVFAHTQQPILVMQADAHKDLVMECERHCTAAEPVMNSHVRIA